jgi:hypothetical protein
VGVGAVIGRKSPLGSGLGVAAEMGSVLGAGVGSVGAGAASSVGAGVTSVLGSGGGSRVGAAAKPVVGTAVAAPVGGRAGEAAGAAVGAIGEVAVGARAPAPGARGSVVAPFLACPTGGGSVTPDADAASTRMAVIARAKAHTRVTIAVSTGCASWRLARSERPGSSGLDSLERRDATRPNASNCSEPPGRRDAPRSSQHPEDRDR